jgi:hypothetical protein
MHRLLPLMTLMGLFALASPAAAQPLDLTMTIDLSCGAAPVSGTLGVGNVATTGAMCGGLVPTPGYAQAYGVNLTSGTEVTITVNGGPVQIVVLQLPFTANSCVAWTPIGNNPSLTLCLPAGYYPILLTSALDVPVQFEIGVACLPCEPVANETDAWGAVKSLYR